MLQAHHTKPLSHWLYLLLATFTIHPTVCIHTEKLLLLQDCYTGGTWDRIPYPVAIAFGSVLLSLKRKDLLRVTSTSLMKGLPAMKQRTTSDSNLPKSNIALLLIGFTIANEAEGSLGTLGRYRLQIMPRSLAFDCSSGFSHPDSEEKSLCSGELPHLNCERRRLQPTGEGGISALTGYQLDKVVMSRDLLGKVVNIKL